MATSGALGPFLSAMLQLRAQRIAEEENKSRAQSEMMSGIGQGLSAAAKGIGGAFAQYGEDQMYNKLSGEAFGGGGGPTVGDLMANAPGTSGSGIARPLGRLGAADTSAAPSDFTLPVTSTPNRFTGGKAEFEARMKMMELRDKIDKAKATDIRNAAADTRAEAHLTIAQAKEAREAAKGTFINRLFEQAPKDAQDIIKSSLLYQAKTQDLVEKQRKAMANNDPEAYEAAKREHQAYNTLFTNKKLGTEMVPVEPYVSRDLAERFAALSEAEAAAKGGGARQQSDYQTALQEVAPGSGQGGLSATPGASVALPPRRPAYTQLDPGMLNRIAEGGQVTQQEAQQVTGMQNTPATSPGAAAPGAASQAWRNPKTGQSAVWNTQTGKWEIK